jgi:hypothetical protein
MNAWHCSENGSAPPWHPAAAMKSSIKSEWLGYLPFGVYHWIEHLGRDLSSDLPGGWTLEDLLALEQAGFLHRLDASQNPEDEFDRQIRYRVDIERT